MWKGTIEITLAGSRVEVTVGAGLHAPKQYAGVLLAGAEAEITQSVCKSLKSIKIENKITKL